MLSGDSEVFFNAIIMEFGSMGSPKTKLSSTRHGSFSTKPRLQKGNHFIKNPIGFFIKPIIGLTSSTCFLNGLRKWDTIMV